MVIWCSKFIVWILCFSEYCVSLFRASWALSSGMQWVAHTIHQAAGKAYNRLPGLRWRHWADRGDNGVFTEKTGSKRCLGHTFPMFRNFLVVWLRFNCKLCNWVTSWNVNVVHGCRITVTDCIFCGKSWDKPTDLPWQIEMSKSKFWNVKDHKTAVETSYI